MAQQIEQPGSVQSEDWPGLGDEPQPLVDFLLSQAYPIYVIASNVASRNREQYRLSRAWTDQSDAYVLSHYSSPRLAQPGLY